MEKMYGKARGYVSTASISGNRRVWRENNFVVVGRGANALLFLATLLRIHTHDTVHYALGGLDQVAVGLGGEAVSRSDNPRGGSFGTSTDRVWVNGGVPERFAQPDRSLAP
jgi:hypothetical protein